VGEWQTKRRVRCAARCVQVKLLYALHWVILDAAAECEDAENEARLAASAAAASSTSSYLLSLDDIQVQSLSQHSARTALCTPLFAR